MRILAPLLPIAATSARADGPVIEDAQARSTAQGWRFDVTMRHPATGGDHYADGWEVLAPDGTRLGLRPLTHPHETEQPFTRSLSGVVIPEGITTVTLRARCSVDGWAGTTFTLPLPK